jgi:hypothetical protein
LLRFKHRPILIKHVRIGPTSHPILKGGYLNMWKLRRWRRARRLKPLSIVDQLHRVPHLLVCPPRPLLLHLDAGPSRRNRRPCTKLK